MRLVMIITLGTDRVAGRRGGNLHGSLRKAHPVAVANGLEAAQAQRVGDDGDAGERHRGAGDDRVEQPERGEWQRGEGYTASRELFQRRLRRIEGRVRRIEGMVEDDRSCMIRLICVCIPDLLRK